MEQPDGDRKKIARAGDEPVARSSATWPDLTGIHAFLIEDNSDTRTMVSEVLIHCGAMVTVYALGGTRPLAKMPGASATPCASKMPAAFMAAKLDHVPAPRKSNVPSGNHPS